MYKYNFAPKFLKGPSIKYFLTACFGTSKMPKKWKYEVCSCSSKLGLGRFWESCGKMTTIKNKIKMLVHFKIVAKSILDWPITQIRN